MSKQSTNSSTHMTYEFSIKKQFSNELLWNSDFSLYFILKGYININLVNRGHLLHQNDLFFLEPFHTFSVITHSSDLRVLQIIISSDFLNEFIHDFESIQYKTHYIRHNVPSAEHTNLSKNIGQIILHSLKEGTCERLKCVSAVSNIITILVESYGLKDLTPIHHDDYTKERIRDIINYINSHYDQKIMLSDISNFLGIHPQYFSSFFKKHFDKTFIDYLTNFRIYRSIQSLINSDDNILTIAINHGFTNHKTYSSAFKKAFGSSPSSYRQDHRLNHLDKDSENMLSSGLFYYFQQFWDQSPNLLPVENQLQKHISINSDFTQTKHTIGQNQRPLFLDAGRATSCLRGEIQEQIRIAKNELGFDYLRFRDIFSDDLFVYHEEADKIPVFNWQYIDIIIDFLVSANIKPFFEIGFMPRHLASKKQYAGWNFHPNVSYPKSIDKWTLLLSNFLRHCIERYGLNKVHSWYFDFWVCPDLDIQNGYWNESMEKFFEFYHSSYIAVKNISKDIRIGSPTFTCPNGLSWYDAYFTYCHQHNITPSYISVYLYGTDIELANNEFISYSNSREQLYALTDKNYIPHLLDQLKEVMKQHQFHHLDIIVSNWNISYLPQDLSRDTSFMGPYMEFIQTSLLGKVFGMCFRSLSDVNEDFFPHSNLFHGGTGLMDFYGIKKTSYYAYYFFTRLGQTIIDRSDYYIMTKSEKGYQILIYNLSFYDSLYRSSDQSAISYDKRYNIYEETEIMNLHMILTIERGTYFVKKSSLNRKSGSAYDLWLNMGAPKPLDPSVIDYVKNKSIPEVIYSTEEISNNLILDTSLEPHEVKLIEIELII